MFLKTHYAHMVILRLRKNNRIFIAVAILSLVVSLLYLGMYVPQSNDNPLLMNYESKKINSGTKNILLANSIVNFSNWFLPGDTVNHGYFENQHCPHTNCLITKNREHLPSISFFDAVVFSVAKSFPNNTVPLTRSAEQLYVFAIVESPINTRHNLDSVNDFFNLTMTYRLDSDIFWPYGCIRDMETKAVIAPALKPHWRSPPDHFTPDENLIKRINGKTKKAAWFVSHCKPISKRDELGNGIKKYFGLDIYGDCGNLTCPRTTPEECYKKLDNDYKFYLAFENSLCEDYVTEKLYYALGHDTIPIVYGGADYNRFAPPNSYINANNFPTTSALAKYLKYLDLNQTEYSKYFWWKKYYAVSYETPFCQLCTILNKPSSIEKTQIYKNIKEWWFGSSCNVNRKIFFD